ncbi:MAG: ferrous iron transport protein B [Promethearchaeota archaeon]
MEKKKVLRVALAGNANVGKSLSGNEFIFVNKDLQWKIIKLKNLVNKSFEILSSERIKDTDIAKPQNLFVMSLNLKTLKVEKKRVTHILRHTEHRKLLHLITSSGRELKATKDHNFIVLRNGKLAIIDGEELSIGDQLPITEKLRIRQSKPLLDLGKYLLESVDKKNRQYQIYDDYVKVHGHMMKRLLKIDENWARFFGLYLAEGCISQIGQIPRITTGDEEIKDFIENHLKNHSVPSHNFKSTNKSAYDIGISKVLRPILQEFGCISGEKKIPSFVYEWDEGLIESLLKGYFKGDGWKQVTATHASTKSINLQLGLVILLASNNKHVRLNVKQKNGTPFYEVRYIQKPDKKRAQWLERIKGIGSILRQARKATGLKQLEVTKKLGWKSVKGTYISALENERRYVTKKFLRRLVKLYREYSKDENPALKVMEKFAFSDIVWDEIETISEVDTDDGYVYDLTVEDNENFMLANGLFVHNSVVFNQLTGLNQVTGNWPGKTVERAEGTLYYKGYTIQIIDLPGIYSLSAYSLEEVVSREYIALERPDIIINVIDASNLERNLYFTVQLLELEAPVIMACNQMDFCAKKGICIDLEKLSSLLNIPVIGTTAISGAGIDELISTVVSVAEEKKILPQPPHYGDEIEKRIQKLKETIKSSLPELSQLYPPRWIAIKLLEKDAIIVEKVQAYEDGQAILELARKYIKEVEELHGHISSVAIAAERYNIANHIAQEAQEFVREPRLKFEEKLDTLTSHRILGYPILIGVMAAMFAIVFLVGDFLISILEGAFYVILLPNFEIFLLNLGLPPIVVGLIVHGFLEGIIAGITIALPYIIPFYLILAFLEDTGYLPRAAFLMDNIMHKMGLHGKAFIPLILGYGCSVPACVGCRIMETDRERLIAGFVVVLIPCAARTVVILGLVARYLGLGWAMSLYLFNLILIFILGRIAFKTVPGEPVGLIMEMPAYKRPSLKVMLIKTWNRSKDFVYIAFPLMVAGSLIIELIRIAGFLEILGTVMAPIFVNWLGLPDFSAIPLVFGILRKELTLILLAEVAGTVNFDLILTPVQMIVFALVTMIYIPCIATIGALLREYGWKRTAIIIITDIALALILGGITFRLLSLFL